MKQLNLLEPRYRRLKPWQALVYLFAPDAWRLLAAALLYVVKHSPAWAMPLLTASVINAVSQPGRYPLSRIWIVGGIFALLVLQNIFSHAAHIHFLSMSIRRVESELRGALIRRLQHLSIGFLEGTQTGVLQAKVLRDVEAVQGLLTQLINVTFSSVLAITFAVSVTWFKCRVIILFYLVCVPVAVVLVRLFHRQMAQRNRDFRQQIEQMSARLAEMIQLLPLTRAHALEEVEIAAMGQHLDLVRHHGTRLDMMNAFFAASSWVMSQLMHVVCLLVTATMAYLGRIQPGDVVLYTGFFGMIVGSVNQLVDSLPGVTRGLESVRSIGEILECPDIEQNEGKQPVAKVRGRFEFNQVGFAYDGAPNPALADFSLQVGAGETIAVVGESGSGKTTLMSLIVGFRRPTSGTILLDGVDMNCLDLRQYRRHLAVVPQQTLLYSGTIRENLTYGLAQVSEATLTDIIQRARVEEFLDDLPAGLETPIGENGVRLSGGQRQRLAIARALIRNPRVIILDEATSALDVISEKMVQEALLELVRDRTTFIVAHRLSTVRHAHRIVVMQDGRCVEVGPPDQLLAAGGHFARLRNLQV